MKSLFLILICLAASLRDAAAADGQTPLTNAPKVVCFGDSITHRGYPGELAVLLNVPVANAGVGGNSTRDGLARMEADVLKLRPEVAVICFGANDSRLAEPKKHVPVDRYEANLADMVERCLRLGIRPVLCTPPPINPEPYFQRHAREKFDEAGGLEKVVDTYRSAVMRVAEARAIPVVDLNRQLAAQPAWQSADGVHPAPKGNQIIAQLVADKVRSMIKSEKAAAPLPVSVNHPASAESKGVVKLAVPPADGKSDVVIYGGTSAGVIAAVQATRMGKSVVLIEPGKHLGGMTSGGPGNTDVGKPETIGGITREFYQKIHQWYQNPEHWKVQTSEAYWQKADKKRLMADAMFVFEPHVAEQHLHQMLAKAGVPVAFGERLDLKDGVKKDGSRIISIRMESGKIFTGQVFLDCTYEGDLIAKAGVTYTVGREANSQYGELINGVQTTEPPRRGEKPLDPFVRPDDPTSGVIIGLQPNVIGKDGDGDHRVQAYNFRLCLTQVPENRVLFGKPADYDEREFELLFRWIEAGGGKGLPATTAPMPNGKTDSNKAGWVSTDYMGHADNYPDADHATREKIINDHIRYTKGLLWTAAYHPRVPDEVRRKAASCGYAKDEFVDNGHFPFQLYARECRRMVGALVMTEHEVRSNRKVENPVALGSYGMDSHPTQLWVKDGALHADTPPWTGVKPYGISYRALTPKAEQCSNLLVPVCLSASHSAYGSLRMEPVYMMLGQVAATAAVLAVEGKLAVQDVPYTKLREQLLKDGQRLEAGSKPAATAK